MFKSRETKGDIRKIKRKGDGGGDWGWSFSLEDEKKNNNIAPITHQTAGFDFGLTTFLTASNGQKIQAPRPMLEALQLLQKRSCSLSKASKGSKSRQKKRIALSRLHRHISNVRDAFHWQLALQLIRQYDILCFEDLNIQAMQRLWGRKINDYAFNAFLTKIEYIALKNNKRVVKIDRYEATTKKCSVCGEPTDRIPLKVRKWTCSHCHTEHDRDINAAINIHQIGLAACVG